MAANQVMGADSENSAGAGAGTRGAAVSAPNGDALHAFARSPARMYVLWAVALATLISAAAAWSDAVAQQNRWPGAMDLQHLGLRPYHNVTLPLSPDAPSFEQTFRVDSDLEGIDIAIAVGPDGRASPYELRIADTDGHVLRTAAVPTAGLHNGGWLRFDFAAVRPPPNNALMFSLVPQARPVAHPLSVQLSAIDSYPQGTLRVDGMVLSRPVAFEPRVRITKDNIAFVRKLRNHAAQQVRTVLFAACFVFVALLPAWGLRSLAVACGLLFVYMAMLRMPYYGIDEGSHVAIADYWRLHHAIPIASENCDTQAMQTMHRLVGSVENAPFTDDGRAMHEAVQPPLYYMVLATVASIIQWLPQSNEAMAFYAERLFGALLVAFGAFCCIATYQKLVQRGQLVRQDGVFLTVFLSVICSSGYLFNFTAITNDQLCFFLVNLALWVIASNKWQRPLAWRIVWRMAVLCGAMWMTKLTTLGACALLAGLIAFYGSYLQCFAFVAVVAVCVTPWYVANLAHYGAPTGMAEHIAVVLPSVNPMHTSQTYGRLLTFSFPAYMTNFFLSSYDKTWGILLAQMKSWLLLAGLGTCGLHLIGTALKNLRCRRFRDFFATTFATPSGVGLALFASVLIMALQGSKSANIDFFAPRYGYMYAAPVCLFMASALGNIKRRVDRVALSGLLVIATLWLSGRAIHRLPVWIDYHF